MTAFDKAFDDVQQLVKTFTDNFSHYMSHSGASDPATNSLKHNE